MNFETQNLTIRRLLIEIPHLNRDCQEAEILNIDVFRAILNCYVEGAFNKACTAKTSSSVMV